MITRTIIAFLVTCALAGDAGAKPAMPAPLLPAGLIALPDTSGRIDHLAVDLRRKRVFVAELGNNTVDVIDLSAGKVIHRISGLEAPQGLGYAPNSDRLIVACSDGTVHVYNATDFAPQKTIKFDDDADDVRLDPNSGRFLVGHGSGAIALIDSRGPTKLSDIELPAHPEAFMVAGDRAYINVPDGGQIDVVDLTTKKPIAKWTPDRLSSNFPMAADENGHIAVVFRGQNRFALIDMADGHIAAAIDTCRDADDISFDPKRKRFYVSCGSGEIDVVAVGTTGLRSLGRTPTSWGARTSLYVAQLDRLFVAERAGLIGSHVALAIFRPAESTK